MNASSLAESCTMICTPHRPKAIKISMCRTDEQTNEPKVRRKPGPRNSAFSLISKEMGPPRSVAGRVGDLVRAGRSAAGAGAGLGAAAVSSEAFPTLEELVLMRVPVARQEKRKVPHVARETTTFFCKIWP